MGGAGDGLEAVFGAPSDAGFGSAVFRGTAPTVEALEAAALAHYRGFVGAKWERFGEAGEDPGAAQRALAAAFDDPAVTHLLVHALGDGAAMSGVELSARTADGRAVFLVLLMD
jgi:hypothetical protein